MIWLYIILGFLLFSLLGYLVSAVFVSLYIFKKFFKRGAQKPNERLEGPNYDCCRDVALADKVKAEALPFESLTIVSKDGFELFGRFYKGQGKGTVILMHGANTPAFLNFSSILLCLLENGYDVLMPDQRGSGRSGGEYLTYGYFESDDLLRWVREIKATHGGKIAVYGISLGAASVGFAAKDLKEEGISCAIMEGTFTSIENLFRGVNTIKPPPPVGTILFGKIRKTIHVEPKKTLEKSLAQSQTPTLFLHGDADKTVPYTQGEVAYGWCGAEKEWYLAPNLGHAVLSFFPENRERILKFIEKHIA